MDIKGGVFKVVSKVMGVSVNSLSEDSSPDDIEKWDSLQHMNLILALEEEFKVQFSEEQVVNLLNVKLIILEVESLLKR